MTPKKWFGRKHEPIKTFKTTKALLQRSLAEIEAGNWCKGELARHFVETGPHFLSPQKLRDQPMGCALGLVCMFAGLGKITKVEYRGKEGERRNKILFDPEWPEDDSPEAVKYAIIALAKAVPRKERAEINAGLENPNAGDKLYRAQRLVWSYNDMSTTDQAEAAAWFRKAIASL